MKPKKELKKRLTALLTAALILAAGAAAVRPRLTRESVSDSVSAAADDSFSESRPLSELLSSDDESEAEIREAFRSASDFPAAYSELGYQVFYSSGLASDFILVYNSRDIELRKAVTSPTGLLWADHFAQYLSVMSQMTGTERKHLICVFNTDLDSGYPGSNHDTWFHISHDAAFAAAGGILNDRFTHALLHETAHSFHTNFYKMLFNSEEEVYANLRMLCALHWAGMDAGQMMITNAATKWTWADSELDQKYRYKDADMISLTDPAYQEYFPAEGGISGLWDLKTTFVPISVRQHFALSSYADSSADRLFSRTAAIVNAVTDLPVTCSFSDDPADCGNWLNTDAVNENWNTVTEEEWEKLTALCISDADRVSLPEHAKDIVRMYCSWLSQCTEEIRYYFFVSTDGKKNRKEYTVKVTPAVQEMLRAGCTVKDDAYCIPGNLIQAFNMCDFMEIDTDTSLIRNQYLKPAPTIRQFFLDVLTTDYEGKHSFIPNVPAAEIIVQPADADAAVGDTVSFTVEASGIGVTYQWQYMAGSEWRNSVMAGADTATVCKEVKRSGDGQKYRCVVSWPDGHQEISEAATLRIRPTITQQPQNAEASAGETVRFTAAAAGDDVTYRWQENSGEGWTDSEAQGADTAELEITVTRAQNRTLFRCITAGAGGAETVSDEAELTVLNGITKQPEDAEAPEGTTVQFSVAVPDSDVTCQWQYNKGSGWKDSSMTGFDTDTVTVPAVFSRDGQTYRCIVSWPDGSTEISDAAMLRVQPTVLEQPASVTVSPGETAGFTVTAEGSELTYQWESFSGTEWEKADTEDVDPSVLTVTAPEEACTVQYRCVITGKSGAQSVTEPALLTVS